MKVTAVETVVVNARLRNWVFVKVVTDVPGLIGWGESTLEWKTQAVVGAIRDLEPLIVGQDPTRLEHLWQSMYRHQFFQGGVVTTSAISGIDQALHDVVAKSLGVPIYQLLGGRCGHACACTTTSAAGTLTRSTEQVTTSSRRRRGAASTKASLR